MRIAEKGNVKVYYYESKKDLMNYEKELRKLKIGLDHNIEFPKICPIKESYIVLLHNTGDMKKDVEKLNKCLDVFKLQNFKEL